MLMAAAVREEGGAFQVGSVLPLFALRAPDGGFRPFYQVSPDGTRFLVNVRQAPSQTSTAPITVVVNWTAGLKK